MNSRKEKLFTGLFIAMGVVIIISTVVETTPLARGWALLIVAIWSLLLIPPVWYILRK